MSTEANRDTTSGSSERGTDAECEHVLARVHEFLDHELDTATGDEIRAHLSDCEPCLDRFDVEQAVKSLVKRCCGNDKAPAHLRVSIMTKIQVTRGTL
jgi:anti-sigma factor (TIGR02949 family)